MKKIVLLMAAILAFVPVVSFADYGKGVVTLGTDPNELVISTSNSVFLDYAVNGNGLTYSIATYHDKGDRSYLSSSEDANIYWGKGTATAIIAAPAVGTSLGSGQTGFDKTL